MTLISAAIIAAVSLIILKISEKLQTEVVFENMRNISAVNSLLMKQELETYMNDIDTLAKVFGTYRTFEEELRRTFFNGALRSALEANRSFIALFSVWKPGVIDGESSVYSPYYTREHGSIEYINYSIWDSEGYELYMESLEAGEAVQDIREPAYFEVEEEKTYTVTLTAPVIDSLSGELSGMVGVMVDLEPLQQIILELKPYGTGSAGLYSSTGATVAAPERETIGGSLRQAAADSEYDFLDMEEIAVVEEALKTGEYRHIFSGGFVTAVSPFHVGTSQKFWAVLAAVPLETVLAPVRQLTIFTAVLILIMVLAAGAIVFLIISVTLKPVISVSRSLQDISGGEGDLTQTIPVKSRDEVGDLARYFNLTLDKIKNLVITIKNQALILFDTGSELSADMTETTGSVNQITCNIQAIKGRIISQSASVSEANAAMEQITSNINRLNGQVEKQAGSVTRSSLAIEKLLSNIQSVTETLVKNAENVAELSGASELGRGGLQDAAADIQKIARESEGLLEINAVMESIASQTSLLSMNAAIEAAHAGEAGKGFAVVAGEIRKLSESSGEQSKTISAVLKKIKESIDKITLSTENILNKFEAIDHRVKIVAEQETNIRLAMEEQNRGSRQILEEVGELNEITQQVKEGSDEMLKGSAEIIKEGRNLEAVTQEITGGMTIMASSAESISAAVNRVNGISGLNKENIDLLIREVSRFRVE
jgi:methyl-accepting chemotaxis protein